MLVYRIEHPSDGLGPYQSGDSGHERHDDVQPWLVSLQEELCETHHPHTSIEHPAAHAMYAWHNWYVCGCKTVEQLKQWFHGFRTMLRKHGFVCRVYEVDLQYTCEDKYQVGFDRDKATLLQTISIP